MAESINPGVEGWESSTDLKKMSLKPEDIKISFIKNNKLKATISPNTSVFLKDSPTDKAVDAYYDYYHKNKLFITKCLNSYFSIHLIILLSTFLSEPKNNLILCFFAIFL